MAVSMISRIRKGAALLDKKRKGWRKNVNLSKLDMSRGVLALDGCGCILTQLYGNAEVGSKRVNLVSWNRRIGAGFYTDKTGDYPALTRAWKRYLRS